MLQVLPGAYLRLGQGIGANSTLHNSRYDFNDDILPWARRHAGLVECHAVGGRHKNIKWPVAPVHQAQQATNLIVTNDLQP